LASLLGRIIHAIVVVVLGFAVLATSPLQAAPFAAIVIDARSGEVLFEQNADARLHPASLTKMMTLYITFQEIEAGRLSLDTMVTVTKYAASQPPSRLGLKPGQKIALRYLIRAAAVKSANDAAAAIGDHIGGDVTAFAKRMTKTAKQLGMDNTTFRNANGLTADGHLSSARDMNTLGRHLFYDFPQYYNIFSRRTADAGVATVTNTNSRFLDAYEGADGIKTGYTSAAGFNLTASAVRGDKRIIATVFGGTSTANRNAKMKELMDLGFERAGNRVKEQPPVAPEVLPDDAMVATLAIDDLDAEGGSAKTVRVSGAVKVSLRPRARPDQPGVPDEVAIAMAEGIDGALEEATAPPPPEGTLEFQAATMTADLPPEEALEPEVALADATLSPETAALTPGSLEAQAAAIDAGESAVPVVMADATLSDAKPMPRPETLAAETASEAPLPVVAETAPIEVPVVVAEVAPEPETVMTDPGPVAEVAVANADPAAEIAPVGLLAEVTDVETVSAANTAPPPAETQLAEAAAVTDRKAPIFDTVELATAPEVPAEEVVVVMSTSGGRHFGVNVGDYPSRYEAERALLKTALAESATLNDGLRKTAQSDGAWRASFMGLTEEQAELACRRLRARAVPCETVGG
jgi:D-alanyl-D-alanine carboxypeptidase